jgi:hypothetical protein
MRTTMRLQPKVFLLLLLPAAFIFSLVNSCEHDTVGIDTLDTVCFEQSVLPVFVANCAMSGCHSQSGGEAGLQLNDYAGIMEGVTPYKPSESQVYKAIIAKWGEGIMPPDHALSLAQRTNIRVWIEQGAKETTCNSPSDTLPVDYVNPFACFQRDIEPILVSNCSMSGCHSSPPGEEADFSLFTYSAVMASGKVHPGSPSGSKLYQAITGSGEDFMPPSPATPLNQAQIDSIYSWIARGAKNENCGTVCDTTDVTFSGSIWPVVQNSCTGCHSGANASKGVHLENYTDVAAVAASGTLLKVLTGVGAAQMPPSGKMSSCTIRMFELWIDQGYPNN